MRRPSNGWQMPWRALFALSVVLACAPPTRPPAPPRAEADVRVGVVVGAQRIRVGGQGGVAAVAGGLPAFRIDDSAVTLEPDGRALRVSGAASGRFESLTFVSVTEGRHVTIDDRPYRGVVEVIVRDGALTAINVVSLERYLYGVVNAEMGRRGAGDRAALEAQAVASRTYALRNLGRFAAQGYDLRASVTDQVYAGVESETAEGAAAVRATTGLILVHGGEPISAFFHSTCGGSTAAPEESFRTISRIPYLRPVSDRRRGGGYYCDISPRFQWRVEWDGAQLRDILRRTIPATVGIEGVVVDDVRNVYVRRTGPSGRASDTRIAVGGGEIPIAGVDLRQVLETPEGRPLGSTAVRVQARHQGDRLTGLEVEGNGWGHGVGMCQWGAIGRARAGQSHQAILGNYFPGASLVRWY